MQKFGKFSTCKYTKNRLREISPTPLISAFNTPLSFVNNSSRLEIRKLKKRLYRYQGPTKEMR